MLVFDFFTNSTFWHLLHFSHFCSAKYGCSSSSLYD